MAPVADNNAAAMVEQNIGRPDIVMSNAVTMRVYEGVNHLGKYSTRRDGNCWSKRPCFFLTPMHEVWCVNILQVQVQNPGVGADQIHKERFGSELGMTALGQLRQT